MENLWLEVKTDNSSTNSGNTLLYVGITIIAILVVALVMLNNNKKKKMAARKNASQR
jgi:hypothetical protein